MEEIVAKGGFKFKKIHMSGDPIKHGELIKVLGLIWNTEKDEFQVDIKVNFSGKRGGVNTAPDVDLDENLADKDLQQTVTKRLVWRIAQSQYDPLGLLAPYTVKLKAVIRELCSKEGAAKRGWDDIAPTQTVENFRNAISGLGELKKITLPRSIHPGAKVK